MANGSPESTCWREKNQRNFEHTARGGGDAGALARWPGGRGAGEGEGSGRQHAVRDSSPGWPRRACRVSRVLGRAGHFALASCNLFLQPCQLVRAVGAGSNQKSDHTHKTATGSNLRPPPAGPQKEGFKTANCPQRPSRASAGDAGCIFHPVPLSGSPLGRSARYQRLPRPSVMAEGFLALLIAIATLPMPMPMPGPRAERRSSMLDHAGRISNRADKSYLIVSDLLGEPLPFAAWNPGFFCSARCRRQTKRQLAGSHFLLRCPRLWW